MMPAKYQFYYNYDNGHQEHQQRNAVDTMHITHPLGSGRIGVFLFQVQVLGQLS